MKKIAFISLSLLVFSLNNGYGQQVLRLSDNAGSEQPNQERIEQLKRYDNSNPKSVDLGWLNNLLVSDPDSIIYVVNFWATWCKPCIEEMPYFNRLLEETKNLPVKIYLVSCDMRKVYDLKLGSFTEQKGIKPEVVWMSEQNANNWIDFVDPEWSGALPATIITLPNKYFKWFKEGETTYTELNEKVQQALILRNQ
jgi:thiol-disulfide isomerase/thioredoxin